LVGGGPNGAHVGGITGEYPWDLEATESFKTLSIWLRKYALPVAVPVAEEDGIDSSIVSASPAHLV
jgi:hypothetical protein